MPAPFRRISAALFMAVFAHLGLAQSLPTTAGETLSGRPIVLAEAVRGHQAVLVAGFSREGGSGTGAWMKALHADSNAAGVQAYQIAMLTAAPSFFRGMIRNGMKKGVSPSDQDRFVVLTTDEQSWRNFFGVTTDSDPYVVLLNAQGKVIWRGHGAAAQFEAQLKSALR